MRRRLALLLPLIAAPALAAEALHTRYVAPVAAVVAAAQAGDGGMARLAVLCDRFGHRITGSERLERAIEWAAAEMKADGLQVQLDTVPVQRWIRGEESLQMVAPEARPLQVLALGMSVGTPPGGIEADVVVVGSLAEIDDRVKGKIVLVDLPFTTYGETVGIRSGAAVHGGRHGAVAALIRSVTPESLNTPHTGATRYAEDVPPIPVAAVSVEDASWMHRLQDMGVTPRVKLSLGAHMGEPTTSHNVIGDLRGREKPEEIVLLGCHYDSWDVGQGAQDDGAGCLTVWEAALTLKRAGMVPRRTVRVVLFTNEENGLAGGKEYFRLHGSEVHVAAVEADTGSGKADGFRVDVESVLDPAQRLRAEGLALELAALFDAHGGGRFLPGGSGADISPLVGSGVVGFGLANDLTGYWPIHHTWADTYDKVKPEDMRHNVGLVASLAWVLAEMDERLVEAAAPARKKR